MATAWGLISLVIPLPYVIVTAGETQNVLGTISIAKKKVNLIEIKTMPSYPDNGELRFTTISVTNPDFALRAIYVIPAWINPNQNVLPREVIYPKRKSVAQVEKEQKLQMVDSQREAKLAALNYLNQSTKIEKITISAGDVGGPSAGLIFALGIVEKLTAESLTRGRVIAGTGTISASGEVGKIGGIDEKIQGAKSAKAKIFLSPIANCADISKKHPDVQIVGVKNLSAAINFLKGNNYAAGIELKCARV